MSSKALRAGIVATMLLGTTMGCAGKAASAPASTTAASVAADDDAMAGLMEHHRFHHHGGVTLFIAMSLDTLGVSPDQRAAIDAIRSTLHARMEPSRAAEQSLANTLADGLGGPSFDAAKLDAAVAQLTAFAAATHDACADAFNQLHAVLTPAERAALVDKVEAHWAVWQSANADETGSPNPDGHLATLAFDLDLTPDQVEKIRSGLREGMKAVPRLDSREIAAHLKAFDDSFRSDAFDARSLTAATTANAHMVGWGAAYMTHFVETASAVLTPEQRDKLAKRLRDHATHDPSAQVSQ